MSRLGARGLAGLLALLLAAVAPLAAQEAADPETLGGMPLYQQYCSQCHGVSGAGDGVAAPLLSPPPRDFTTGKYKVRHTGNGELPLDEDLARAIRQGLPYTAMPAFDWLTDAQVRDLVEVLKGFSPDFQDPRLVPERFELPRPPSWDDERAAAGREVYERTGCALCHGNLGRGDGSSAARLVDDQGKFIRVADLTMPWTFRGGGSRQDIFRTMSVGFNGTPMPGFADALSEEERWQITDYMLSLAVADPDDPYADFVTAVGVEAELELDNLDELFAEAPKALLPIVGQIIQPGRTFTPGALAVQVQAVYNRRDIAVRLVWHDMTAERSGHNAPDLPVSDAKLPGQPITEESLAAMGAGEGFSDAVAVQLPRTAPEGVRWPYFLFGDTQAPVELWYADLADPEARLYVARGSQDIQSADAAELRYHADYADGAWTVTFLRPRAPMEGVSFSEDRFLPAAFTVWDGRLGERGNRRGLTRWYSIYLEPLDRPSPLMPALRSAALALAALVLIVFLVRRRERRRSLQPAVVPGD